MIQFEVPHDDKKNKNKTKTTQIIIISREYNVMRQNAGSFFQLNLNYFKLGFIVTFLMLHVRT